MSLGPQNPTKKLTYLVNLLGHLLSRNHVSYFSYVSSITTGNTTNVTSGNGIFHIVKILHPTVYQGVACSLDRLFRLYMSLFLACCTIVYLRDLKLWVVTEFDV